MMCLLARICRCYMHLSLIADMQSLFGKVTPFQQVTIIGYLFSPVKRKKLLLWWCQEIETPFRTFSGEYLIHHLI